MHNSLLHLLLKNGDFLNTDISQGSVATHLGCGGVFVFDFVTNFLLSLTVKEFWKSVNIWWSYGQELVVLFFFDSQYRYVLCWHWAFMSFFHHIHVYNNIIMITVFFLMSAETCMNIVKINILFLNYPVNEDWWLYWQASKTSLLCELLYQRGICSIWKVVVL